MHLKILIGLVSLVLTTVNANAKAKSSPQEYSNGPVSYYPVAGIGLAQNAAQSFVGPQSSIPFNSRFALGNNFGYSLANSIGGNVFVNPQAYQGTNNYLQPIPVPVGYFSGSLSANGFQSARHYGRLWPKHLVDLNGTPSPPPSESNSLYNPVSSTPNPQTYQSSSNNDNSRLLPNFPYVSTPSPIHSQYPQLPIQANFDSGNFLQQNLFRYNTPQPAQNSPVFGSTGAQNINNYQQPTTSSPLSQNQKATASPPPNLLNYQQPTATAFIANNYQQPFASPFAFQNQQITGSPAPYLFNYQQTPPRSNAINYQQTIAAPFIFQNQQASGSRSASPNQQSVSTPYVGNYQQPLPVAASQSPYLFGYQQPFTSLPVPQQLPAGSYERNYQQLTGVPYSVYQQQAAPYYSVGIYNPVPSVSPNGFYQQNSQGPVLVQYQQPIANYQTTPTPNVENFQRNTAELGTPTPDQIQFEKIKPNYSVSSTTANPHSVTIESSSPALQTTGVTEKSVKATTPTPVTLRPEIIKTEYSGDVSPQYNHITPTPSSIRLPYGADPFYTNLIEQSAYVPLGNFGGYSPSPTVSNVKYDGLGTNYSY